MNFVFLNDRGLRAGWRLLIYVAMLALVVSAAGMISRRVGPGPGAQQPSGYMFPVVLGLFDLAAFLVLLFLAWIMSRIEHRSVGAYGLPLPRSAVSRFLNGYVFWGFLPLSVLLLVMRVLHVFYFGNIMLHGRQILIWAALWGFTFLMVGLFEEFLFRGYGFHTLAEGIGFWPAAIILSVLFAFAHFGNKGETRIGIVGVVAFGLFAAATLWRTGNLWLAVGAHAGWDWGQSFFFGVSDSGFQAPGHLLNPHSTGPDWLSGGSVGPEGSALTLLLLTVMTVLFLAMHRSPREPVAMTTSAEGMR
ncbi:MAG: CPBP family intramembrane glutamic endopeptidase [Terriglobales bacterium]